MKRPKLCTHPEHMSEHGQLEFCPVCNGRILRFDPGPDPGLDDLMEAAPEPAVLNPLDQIPAEVVIRHRCHCERATELPDDGEPDEHVFTVDGADFPFRISERGPIVTRLADDLYAIDIEIIGLGKELTKAADGRDFHRILEFGYNTYGGNAVPYIPVIDGAEFPWLLTDGGCQLNFGHKIVPTLRLAFLARNVTGNYPVADKRPDWEGRDVHCNGGDIILAGVRPTMS